jgi:hypothetical protein
MVQTAPPEHALTPSQNGQSAPYNPAAPSKDPNPVRDPTAALADLVAALEAEQAKCARTIASATEKTARISATLLHVKRALDAASATGPAARTYITCGGCGNRGSAKDPDGLCAGCRRKRNEEAASHAD